MDDERARILRMVAEGAVTPEEAADLLEAVSTSRAGSENREPDSIPSLPPVPPMPATDLGRRRNRSVVIQVRDGGESRVNIRIPLGLTRAAGKFIPRQAQGFLNKYEINLQEFLDSAASIDSGTVLEVKDGDSHVLIAVE